MRPRDPPAVTNLDARRRKYSGDQLGITLLGAHILSAIPRNKASRDRILFGYKTRVDRDQTTARFQRPVRKPEDRAGGRIVKMMEYADEQDNIKGRQDGQVFRGQVLAKKSPRTAVYFFCPFNIGTRGVKTPIVNTGKQVHDLRCPAAYIQDLVAGPRTDEILYKRREPLASPEQFLGTIINDRIVQYRSRAGCNLPH